MRKSKKGSVLSVDFTGVESGGGSVLLPEGLIQLELLEFEQAIGSESKEPYLAGTFAVAEEGSYLGKKCYDNFSLQPQSLWKLRGFLEAAGIEVTDGEMDLDLDDLAGVMVTADIVHEDYKGKPKTRIAGYFPIEEEEPKPAAPKGVSKKKPAPPADDEGFEVKQKVSFKDGRKTITGVITAINEDVITVKAGADEYEMGPEDLTPA